MPRWVIMGRVSRDDVVSFHLWPPVGVGVPLCAGLAATWLGGDPVGLPGWASGVGWILLAVFAVWNGWALLMFLRRRTGLLPGQPTTALMQDGPYRWSRNPLYVGLVAFQLGVALVVPSFWALLLTPVSVAALHWGAIRPEERFLRARFGDAYTAYAARVRRWL